MKISPKDRLRKWIYTNTLAKKIYGIASHNENSRFYSLSHLALFAKSERKGMAFKDEALLLFSLVKMTKPQLVVEFGFCRGHSSLNFLYALDETAELYSCDISDESREIAETTFHDFHNFHFIHKSQTDFSAQDIQNKKIDFVYFDAVYETEINMKTFENIRPSLNDNAVLVLHDTGTWQKKYMTKSHYEWADRKPQNWLNENEYQQQKGQREFYNAFIKKYPEYSAINFHSKFSLNSGMTLLQKKAFLPTENFN